MNKIIFSYRLRSDTGFAPCIDNNIFTLACCKGGQIRNNKNILTGTRYQIGKHRANHPTDEIYLLGVYENKLLYYAMATEIIPMTEYYSKERKCEFGERVDHIFDVENGLLKRNSFLPDIHPEGDQSERDKSGIYVIISRKFTYFGKAAPSIPLEVLAYLPKKQETKRIIASSEGFLPICDYINNTVSFNGVIGKPHNPIGTSKCGVCKNENYTFSQGF